MKTTNLRGRALRVPGTIFIRRLQEDSLNKPPGEGNSQNRQILSKIDPERVPEMTPKHMKSLPNGRQQGGAFGAAPRGRRFAPPPWGSCCLACGKDFQCFSLISGAHPEAFPPSFFGLSTFLGFP